MAVTALVETMPDPTPRPPLTIRAAHHVSHWTERAKRHFALSEPRNPVCSFTLSPIKPRIRLYQSHVSVTSRRSSSFTESLVNVVPAPEAHAHNCHDRKRAKHTRSQNATRRRCTAQNLDAPLLDVSWMLPQEQIDFCCSIPPTVTTWQTLPLRFVAPHAPHLTYLRCITSWICYIARPVDTYGRYVGSHSARPACYRSNAQS